MGPTHMHLVTFGSKIPEFQGPMTARGLDSAATVTGITYYYSPQITN
jgi:hypothetical protein